MGPAPMVAFPWPLPAHHKSLSTAAVEPPYAGTSLRTPRCICTIPGPLVGSSGVLRVPPGNEGFL